MTDDTLLVPTDVPDQAEAAGANTIALVAHLDATVHGRSVTVETRASVPTNRGRGENR